MNVQTLTAQRHKPPAGWSPEVFERVTDALAEALVAAYSKEPVGCGATRTA